MDDQQANRGPSQVFRENLQRLASAQGLELDGLASSLGFIRDDKKWLRRAWNDGLARPDKRAMPRLEKIVARFGLDEIDELWNPQAAEDQATVLRSVQMNDAAWEQLVGQIIEYIEALQVFRGMNPKRAAEIESAYGFDSTKMISEWARRCVTREGADGRVRDDEAEVLAATKQAREFLADSDSRNRVMMSLMAKDEWKQMTVRLREELGPDGASKEWHRRLAACFADPMTEAEVVRRFFSRHLEEFADPEVDDALVMFVEDIREHPAWYNFVAVKHGGDEETAIDRLIDMWEEFEKQTGGAMPMEKAVHYFSSRILDPFLEDEADDKLKLAEGLSTKKNLD